MFLSSKHTPVAFHCIVKKGRFTVKGWNLHERVDVTKKGRSELFPIPAVVAVEQKVPLSQTEMNNEIWWPQRQSGGKEKAKWTWRRVNFRDTWLLEKVATITDELKFVVILQQKRKLYYGRKYINSLNFHLKRSMQIGLHYTVSSRIRSVTT